jgi:hypothetical protein
MKFEITADRGDERNVIERVRHDWIVNVLQSTGIDFDDCFENEEDLTILQKAKIRKILIDNDVLILDDNDGCVKIYIQKEIIAEWEKPIIKLKIDQSELDRKKKYFVIIEVSCWSVFDEE